MTCPDWTRLAAHRHAAPETAAAAEPREWASALEHLEGCPGCRREAVAADPTLAFRRLPTPTVGPAEVDEIRAGVEALRRARRLEAGAPGAGHAAVPGREGSRSRSWSRAAAAAGLLTALVALGPAVEPDQRAGDRRGASAEADASARGAEVDPRPPARLDPSQLLAVDEIEHPTASVYHFDAEEVAVVMVVDAGFDV